MESAKSSVKKFMSKTGHHNTSVHEKVAPAVEHETVARTEHEQATTAIDREVHQDHYHTSEQPVHHAETLPEQHHHNLVPTEHRSYEHDDADHVQRRLAEQQSQYKSHSQRVEGEHTQSVEPTVAGEHVHHHVHETIQPVVQKQTVEPHVVHTTVPIHEVHHNESKHHAASALPAMSMDDFKKQGGSLTGREERHDQFDGCPPEPIASHQNGASRSAVSDTRSTTAPSSTDMGSNGYASKPAAANVDDDLSRHSGDRGFRDSHKHPAPASYGNDMHDKTSGSTSSSKPSLMDKLNPSKDANGDGKPGFMK